MGWQPGQDDDWGADPGPARDPRDPGAAGSDDPSRGRDPRLAGFAKDAEWDTCPPSAALAAVMEDVSGPEWRCPDATRDEMLGMLRQSQALESRAAATKLGILRALIREDDEPMPGGGYHGDLPEGWSKSLTHEAALVLATPAVSADKLLWVAWDLEARLPGIGALLAAGALTYAKAKVVSETFLLLSDENAARAETMILPQLSGKTYGQVKRLAEQAAITVDPEAAARRREHAERENSRVTMFREDSGAVALSGRDLPTDQALAALAHVCARAQRYKDSGAFPADTRMDRFRVAAYLDLLNGKSAEARIASGQLDTVSRTVSTETGTTEKTLNAENAESGEADGARADGADGAGNAGNADDPGRVDDDAVPSSGTAGCAADPRNISTDDRVPNSNEPDDDEPGEGGLGDNGPGPGGSPPDSPGSPGSPGSLGPPTDGGCASATPPRLVNLVLPLATLLGLAERPGESHDLGPLDPDLCRQLAIAAIGSPWTRLCVTVTDSDGIATGHGCARLPRRAQTRISGRANEAVGPGAPLSSQVNLTISAGRLAELAATGPPRTPDASWSFTRVAESGPPGGFGTWTLTLPDGRQLTVALETMPTFECFDHRYETHGYHPSEKLRHLVQVRDYTCTFPTCNRHAKDSDFEHGLPYDKGGRTCACNAGARSRACHQVKQTKGWKVSQPRPGWHQWQTPSGRVYVQEPKRYPT